MTVYNRKCQRAIVLESLRLNVRLSRKKQNSPERAQNKPDRLEQQAPNEFGSPDIM